MARIVYAHRLQGLLRQVVVDLGLTLTLTDESGEISLRENEQMFRDVAASMSLQFGITEHSGVTSVTFRPR